MGGALVESQVDSGCRVVNPESLFPPNLKSPNNSKLVRKRGGLGGVHNCRVMLTPGCAQQAWQEDLQNVQIGEDAEEGQAGKINESGQGDAARKGGEACQGFI
eukprot:6480073-Amphidinium_carterae.2